VNWDDLRYFLAVCRTGTIRAAAQELGVNHATVSRRINSFEESLDERLFERSASGYECTAIGSEVYDEASHLELTLKTVERRIAGKDTSMLGDIRVTLPDMLGAHLLMPFFAEFCALYPDIELEIIDSHKALNLTKRDADVAFRLCDTPPEYLIGRKIGCVHRAVYTSKKNQSLLQDSAWLAQQSWLGWSDKLRRPIGRLAKEHPNLGSKHKIMNALLQLEACKEGLGICILPCFCADTDPDLVRVPPYTSVPRIDFWILSHPDMRQNTKIQTFVRFMIKKLDSKRSLIEGEDYQRS